MAINLMTLINDYKSKRYNAFIIYGEAGVGKTTYLKEFIGKNQIENIFYIDVIEEYKRLIIEQPIFGFNPSKFIKWVLSLFNTENQIRRGAFIIDNFDFLINTWSPDEKNDFLKLVDKYIEKSVIDVPVIFVVHTDPIIEIQVDKKSIIKFSELELLNNY